MTWRFTTRSRPLAVGIQPADPVAISGIVGADDEFDRSITGFFFERYVDQMTRGFQGF